MFRPIKKKKNEISLDAAKQLLHNSRRGVLAMYGMEGYPYSIPINYFYKEEANKIYFHGARVGHKVDAIKANEKVCFTVYGNESIKDEAWAPYLQSALVFGKCRLIEDREEIISLVREFAMKYYPNRELVEEEIQMSGKAVQMFEIEIDHLSGKQIQER